MKHIETKCAEENKARKDYAVVKPGDPVVADEGIEATVRELLALRHKMDEDELRASKLKAVIMEAMKSSEELRSKSGELLVTWRPGKEKVVVDYAGILKKYNVAAEDVAAFSTKKTGTRTFVIELD